MISNKYSEAADAVNPPSAPAPRAEGMAGLAKGLAILEAFGSQHASLTISEAADLANISRAAARRCLHQLVELGYLIAKGKIGRASCRERGCYGYISVVAVSYTKKKPITN